MLAGRKAGGRRQVARPRLPAAMPFLCVFRRQRPSMFVASSRHHESAALYNGWEGRYRGPPEEHTTVF